MENIGRKICILVILVLSTSFVFGGIYGNYKAKNLIQDLRTNTNIQLETIGETYTNAIQEQNALVLKEMTTLTEDITDEMNKKYLQLMWDQDIAVAKAVADKIGDNYNNRLLEDFKDEILDQLDERNSELREEIEYNFDKQLKTIEDDFDAKIQAIIASGTYY